MSRRDRQSSTPATDAGHHWAEADQYQQVAADPSESPEMRAYAQAQYDRNVRIARDAEGSTR